METKNVNISKEYLNRIRRFTAIRPDETFRYIPSVFRDMPVDLQPVFILRPISGEDALKLSDAMTGEVKIDKETESSTIIMHKGEFTSAVCRKGVVGWENFYDVSGNIVQYKNSIGNLPRLLMEELCEAILSRASLAEEEVLGLK